MSIEAINWALNHAPIPTNRKNASSLAIVLIGLANHADSEGRNAFPAVKTLALYTRLKERAVQYAIRDLENLGLITPSDPKIIAAHVRRKDRRPNGWDLAIHTTHTSIHNPDDEVQTLHPAAPDEVHTRPNGVQTTTSRGAQNAAEPSLNHPGTQRARERVHPPTRTARPPGTPPPPV
ncbi:helix-turn-helix domain-containing protein, partial [Kibdelosporangium aridum]